MPRTTTTPSRVAAASLLWAGLAVSLLAWAGGCSDRYEQRRLSRDSPRVREVSEMIAALRGSGPGAVDDVLKFRAASNLTTVQAQSLRATLKSLASAQAVQVERVDKFGDRVYRASLQFVVMEQTRTIHVLLVEDAGRLLWAGQN